MPVLSPRTLTMLNHDEVLDWLSTPTDLTLDLSLAANVHIWALVASAALTHASGSDSKQIVVRRSAASPISRFANAVGFDNLVGGDPPHANHQDVRTVRIRQVTQFEVLERVARDISHLLIPSEDSETQRTLI